MKWSLDNCPDKGFKPESKSPTTNPEIERVIVLRRIKFVALHVNLSLRPILRWPGGLRVPQRQKITRGSEWKKVLSQ